MFESTPLCRRQLLESALALSAALLLPARRSAAADGAVQSAVAESPLIYLSPICSDGKESACQAEVWFGSDADELFIVTAEDGWKSQAVKRGLDKARIWVGDFGPWKSSKDRYKSAPTFLANSALVAKDDSATIERVLAIMGKKYPKQWGKWEPRFRKGLSDGSRVMLRYRPVTL
ncbi:MAG: hypothetical protein VX246_16040 [Myxococcota bacterium]|nr:hypothetical protein [Myxococcota bacterium]